MTTNSMGSSRLFLLPLFFIVGAIAYSNVLTAFFVHDDFFILNTLKEKGLYDYWTLAGYFRPLVSLSVYIDHALWGLNPLGYHLSNVFLHAVNSLLVLLLAGRLMAQVGVLQRRAWSAPLFAGLLFLVLHSHTEAVSWICARSDLIVATFGLGSLYAWLRFRESTRIPYLLASLGLFAGALLSKESAILLPFIIGCYELYRSAAGVAGASRLKDALRLPALFLVLLAVYFPIRYATLGTFVGGHGSSTHLGFRPVPLLAGLVLYPLRTLLPYVSLQRPTGDLLPGISLSEALPYLALLAVLGVAAAIAGSAMLVRVLARDHPERKRPLLLLMAFLFCAFFLLLLPAINVGVISIQDTQSERFAYFSSAFCVLLLVLLLHLTIRDERRFAAVGVALVLLSSVALYRSNENWRAAGAISRSVLESLHAVKPADRFLIVNLPDNINGAYIYRNQLAIESALRLFGDRSPEVAVVSFNNLYHLRDTTTVRRAGDAYAVELSNARTHFRVDDPTGARSVMTGRFEVADLSHHRYRLVLKDRRPGDRLLYYAHGRMMELEPQVPAAASHNEHDRGVALKGGVSALLAN